MDDKERIRRALYPAFKRFMYFNEGEPWKMPLPFLDPELDNQPDEETIPWN